MPTTSKIGNAIRKPFTANKRLFVLLTVAFIIIGLFFAVYYSHIKSNEYHYQESKLLSLDSNFDIITKRLDNQFQIYHSTLYDSIYSSQEVTDALRKTDSTLTSEEWDSIINMTTNRTGRKEKILLDNKEIDLNQVVKKRDSIVNKEIRPRVWGGIKGKVSNMNSLEEGFDEYIAIFKKASDSTKGKQTDSIIEISSLKGRVILPDTLNKLNPFNIGMSLGVPEKDKKYQLFGREYKYETNLDSNVSYKVTILGFIETERYNEAIRKLDPWIIALLTTFLLLGLFGMPYFKMLFIAEDERLSSNDVILSGISIIVGAPVLVIVFFSIMNHYYDYSYRLPEQLNELSKKIKDRFEEENKENVTALHEMSLSLEGFESWCLAQMPNNDGLSIKAYAENEPYRENFKFISKIDAEKGLVKFHVRLINQNNIKNTKNLESRPYFRDFKASNNVWLLDTLPQKIQYVMRPVVSIEDQSEEAVYIVESREDMTSYRVGASQLKSLHGAIVPFGFQFAVVDESGEVWFHSEQGRATLENFFDVSRNSDKLESAIFGRIKVHGMVKYRDEGRLYSVSPINGTNLSVVALYDIGLLRTRISEVLTLSCIALVLAMVLILIITVLSLIIRNPKLGLYKYDRFLFEFLTPKKELRDSYAYLSILLSALILASMVMSFFIEPTTAYILCLLLAMYSYLIIFYTLHPYGGKGDFKFKIRDILLSAAIIFLNIITWKANDYRLEFVIPSIILQLACLIIIFYNKSFQRIKQHGKNFGRLHLFMEGIKSFSRRKCDKLKIGYRYWYAIFLFSWLLTAAIFPASLIFWNAKSLNDKIWQKTDQIYMARKFVDKWKGLKQNLSSFKGQEEDYSILYTNHLNQGQYHESLLMEQDAFKTDTFEKSDTPYLDEFLWNTRPIYDKRIAEFQGMVYQNAHDHSWSSYRKPNAIGLKYQDNDSAVKVSQKPSESEKDSTLNGLIFMVLVIAGFLLLLAVLFSLILFFSDRFFAFRFRHLKPSDFDTNKEEGYVEKFAQILHDEKSNSGLLLIGPPFCGKQTFAKEILTNSVYEDVATLSMLQLENIDPDVEVSQILSVLHVIDQEGHKNFHLDDYEVFIIEHLEHNIKSFDANHIKLRVILFLISKRKRIILVSEVYPSQIFAMYESYQGESDLPWGSLKDDFNSWRNILSAFPQILMGITENSEKVQDRLNFGLNKYQDRNLDALAILKEELGYSKFLPTLAPVIMAKSLYPSPPIDQEIRRLDRQRMVMHTQNLAHGYYNDIWNTLPTRERYLLYDLAKDGFMNIKNRNSLFSLMKKGLIVWNDRPKIFNYSFKNFIMTSVSLNEALRLENKNRGKGTWARTRIFIYLIIITVIVFIGLGKPELFNDFEALIGTLGGLGVVIPLVSKMLASVGHK